MIIKRLFLLLTISFQVLFSQSFDASNYSRQNDLFLSLTNTLKKNVDSNLDTLLFKKTSGDGSFYFTWDTYGASAPSSLSAFEENRVYQNLVFENSSVSNTWNLGATQTTPCNPCQENNVIVTTKSLTLNNTALEFVTKRSPDVDTSATRIDYIEDFLFENSSDYARLNLNNGHLLINNTFGSGSLVGFRSDTIFTINGNDNLIQAAGGAFDRSLNELYLDINKNSSLTISNSSDLQALEYGHINMQDGSSLLVIDSRIQLTSDGTNSKYFSTFDNASISVSGLLGSDSASLEITNPTFKNTNISLDNNTYIRSLKKTSSSFTAGDFFFEGNNNLVLNSGSKLTGNESSGNDTPTVFNFSDGTTSISGLGKLDILTMRLDNAKVEYSANNISDELRYLYLNNGSELKTNASNGDTFNELTILNVNNSTLNGSNQYGFNVVLKSQIEDSILKIDKISRTSSMAFYIAGTNNPIVDGYVQFSGNNKFISRIDPFGKDVGIDINTITGINIYADAIYFNRK